jgi:hypothetical protein
MCTTLDSALLAKQHLTWLSSCLLMMTDTMTSLLQFQAINAVDQLRQAVDTLIVIPNDKLLQGGFSRGQSSTSMALPWIGLDMYSWPVARLLS